MQRIVMVLVALFSLTGLAVSAQAAKTGADKPKPASELSKATDELVSAANNFKSSVNALIPIYEKEVQAAQAALVKRRELFEQGIISKRDLEAGEQAIEQAQARLDEARKQITESDLLIAEAIAERDAAQKIVIPSAKAGGYHATSAIIRSGGSAGWTLARAAQVQNFFSTTFGRLLPVSAYGQSATHNRMGFDHRNSIDVALHPDSAEGRALIAYLRSQGIPFLAFRSAVPGAATGAHIHIGYPSHRL